LADQTEPTDRIEETEPVEPTDRVLIRIPASTAHIGLVRSAASAVGALLDFTYDRIQDLHIAIDEVCSRIMATSQPAASMLEVEFTIEGRELKVTVKGDAPLNSDATFLTKWSQAILRAVTDGLEFISSDGTALVTFHLNRGVAP